MSKNGFTLVELLVVIAIIGIMASITLVAIGNARSSGADAGIKGNLNSIRVEAERYYYSQGNLSFDSGTTKTTGIADGNGCGTAGMWTNTTIKQALVAAAEQGGTGQLATLPNRTIYCASDRNYWIAAVVLKSDNNSVWCIDSLGKSGLFARSKFQSPAGSAFLSGNCQ